MFQSLLYVIVRVSEHSLARQDYVARLPIAARTTARPVARTHRQHTPRRPFGHKASPPLARQAVARPRGAGGGVGTLKVRCGGVRRGEMTPEGGHHGLRCRSHEKPRRARSLPGGGRARVMCARGASGRGGSGRGAGAQAAATHAARRTGRAPRTHAPHHRVDRGRALVGALSKLVRGYRVCS